MNQLTTTHSKSPLLAALLSAVICGLGQLYNGQIILGILLFVVMCILWGLGAFFGVFTFGLGMIPFAIVAGALWIFGVVNAFLAARKM